MVLTLTFRRGSRIECESVNIIDDRRVEGEESFTVTIVRAGPVSQQKLRLTNSTATIVIIDDDSEWLSSLILGPQALGQKQ